MTTQEGGIRWIKDTEMARLIGISPGALRNWRVEDVRAGRVWPKPGHGGLYWRKFGYSVRYLVTPELLGGAPAAAEVDHADVRG